MITILREKVRQSIMKWEQSFIKIKKSEILEMNMYLLKLFLVIANLSSWTVCKMDTDEESISELGEQIL